MTSFAILAIPVVVLVFGGWLMLEATGRNDVIAEAECRKEPIPLSPASRIKGYTASEIRSYWDILGDAGREAELRFLRVDLLFALFYSAALGFSLLCGRQAFDLSISPYLLLVPVLIGLGADWTENLIQLSQFPPVSGPVADVSQYWISVSSAATRIKMVAIAVAYLGCVAMVAYEAISSWKTAS